MKRSVVLLFCLANLVMASAYRIDDAGTLALQTRHPDSHIKVFLPTMPYLYLSKLVNGTLVRSSGSLQGWEYMMAHSHRQLSPTVYDFFLLEGAVFQDGTAFDADAVLENFEAMRKSPFRYSDLFSRLHRVEKISPLHVRFTLTQPYELFMFDLTMINLYTSTYLEQYGWGFKGASTSNSMKHPGLYGLGPYILKKGFATGGEQTPIIELEANPHYYDSRLPYIQKITIYTELSTQTMLEAALEREGVLDIAPIPFNRKTEAVLSPYVKLITHPSTHNISVYFNMLKHEGVLKDKAVRLALNEAINQENLLKFVYKNEGRIAPTAATRNYTSVEIATQDLPTHFERAAAAPDAQERAQKRREILEGLTLKVYTLERFMFLWKGIEYQLSQYGVRLEYEITTNEKKLYEQLLTNRESPKTWDILAWGNDDWCSNHPWTVFFNYRTDDVWSTIDEDAPLQELLQEFFTLPYNSPAFIQNVGRITKRAYEEAYMLFVPSPNIVLAVNKEISYTPSAVLLMPLWEAKITPYHWSLRQGEYPHARQKPIRPNTHLLDERP